jgi:type I restriction enzyme, S subunit
MAGYQAYPAYKDSGVEWVGNMPESWSVKPLFGVVSTESVKNEDGEETNVLSLSYGNIIRRDVEKNFGLLPESFNTYQLVNPGELILRLTDLQNDKRSLRVGHAKERGIITSAYLKLVAKKNYLNDRYLYRLLHSFDTTKVFYGMGGGLRQSMKFEEMRRLPVLVPSLDEQQKIANFLDHETAKIDTLIEKQQQLIKLLKEKRQAVISHAVTKGLNPNAPMRNSGVDWLGDVPEHWTVTRVKNVVTRIVDGPHFSPKYVDDGYMFISARNIKVNEWSLDDAKYVSESDFIEFNKRVQPEKGDVLLTKGGTTGIARAVDLDFPFQVWVHVAVLKTIQSKMDPLYFAYVLNGTACYEQSQQYTYGATNNDLGLGRIAKIFFAQPPLEEQRNMRLWLDQKCNTFDALIAKGVDSIELMQERRTALISAAVTGKIDVRHFNPEDGQSPEPSNTSNNNKDAAA